MLAILSLAWRNVWRHGRRTRIALAAIAFGVVALIVAGGFIEWIFVDFRESSIHSQLGHIQVTPALSGSGTSSRALLPSDSPALRIIAADPRVEAVVPKLEVSGLASFGETTISFIGDGVDPQKDPLLTRGMTISAGMPLSESDPQGAVFGEGLAANLGVKVGDRVVLLSTAPNGGTNAVEVHVRGIFFSVTKAYDDAALRLPLSTARQLSRVEGADKWIVLLRHTSDTTAVLGELRQSLGSQPVRLTPWNELADFYNKTVQLFSRQVTVVRYIVGAIIVLSISNTMIMNVLERTWEIGTSMALGARRRSILGLFVVEGTLLGLIGGAAGILTGIVLALVLTWVGIPMPPPPGMSHGFNGGVLVTAPIVLTAFFIAALTTLVASLYPALKASRLPIVDALRHNR